MMGSQCELDSFVSKFRYMCSAGYKTSLTFSSENGTAHVRFDANLGFLPPLLSVPPPVSPLQRQRSPSYFRRLKRRSALRQNISSLNGTNSTSMNGEKENDVTEEVAINSKEECSDANRETSLNTENNVAVSSCVVQKSKCIKDYETEEVHTQVKNNEDDSIVMDEAIVNETINEYVKPVDDTEKLKEVNRWSSIRVYDSSLPAKEAQDIQNDSAFQRQEPAAIERLKNVTIGSQVCYKLKSQSMPTLYFEYEKVRCSTCGLPFDSTIELADHGEVFKFCCRMCGTCYRTCEEALPCCLGAGHA